MKVREVMTTKVISVEPSASISQAIRLMLQNRISGLPVSETDGTLIGIITEGDFLRRAETATARRRPRWLEFLLGPGSLAEDYVHTHARTVVDVMSPEPYTVTEETSLEEVVNLMERYRIKRVPVTREKKLVGIVSRANLLHALASLAPTARGPTPEDVSIREKLLSELQGQPWSPTASLNITASNGIVDLWGSITDERQRQAIIVAAQNTGGVRSVRDHLSWIEPMSGVALGPGGAVLR